MAGEINVAYDGTAADLGSNDLSNFSWEDLTSSIESFAPANFTAVNHAGTVSPKDLLMDGNADSIPPSTAFTNLTTPGSAYLDTPADIFETSPMFDSLDAPEPLGPWSPLFPEEDLRTPALAQDMTRTSSSSSQVVVHPGGLSRKRSNPATNSPLTATTRPSSVAGVTKRDKPLPAIVVDANDAVAVKRARNTAAARKSRDKKVQELECLRAKIAKLEDEVEHWRALALSKA